MSTEFETIVLQTGYRVEKDLYDMLMERFEARRPYLIHGVSYTALELYGRDFWSTLTSGQRKMAGMCLVDQVKTGKVPLIPVQHQHEYPKKYQLK